MASRGHSIEPRRPAPRLYLAVPASIDAAGASAALAAALAAADVAAVLLRLPAADERSLINHVKALASVVQDRGAALLLDGHPELVAKAGADGAHLPDIAEFQAALAALKPERIAGCGGLDTRHDAMSAAEGGADYVMFGEPDADGERPSFDAVLERIAWWAEVFEIPCVGFAAAANEIEPLVAAGADFIALGEWVFDDTRGAAQAIAEAAGRLAQPETVG
jgi:thiamine-phosphate pyrophosphorylase